MTIQGTRRYGRLPMVFWGLALAAIAIWSLVPGYVVGWDLRVYRDAVMSLRAGHDPYLDGMAVQRAFHNSALAGQPGVSPPYTYVYSPMTLVLLRWVARLPFWLSGGVFWVVYGACAAAAIWVGMRFADEGERGAFALLAPVAVFLPGLLQNDVLFSGNVAYILYGLALLGAYAGWTRRRWGWFYAVVLVASCFKAPLLCLLAIPVLSEKRQWWPAGAAGAVGAGLFAVQRVIWPASFQHYLQAVELQFSYNHDFSSSVAGLLAGAMYDMAPYKLTSAVAYGATVLAVGTALLPLRQRFLAGELERRQWVPLVVVGAVLLNPRILEYDVAPLTVFLALLAWRTLRSLLPGKQALVAACVGFVCLNAMAVTMWKPIACLTVWSVFLGGVWTLWRQVGRCVDVAEVAVGA